MGGSAQEAAPTLPDAQPVGGVRASDAERDQVVAKLTEEFAAGRLSQDTFLFRMSAVLEARHVSQLPPLLADLPEPAAPGAAPIPATPPTPGVVPTPGVGPTPRAPDALVAPVPPTGSPAVRQSSLVSRLRAALPRRTWLAATQSRGVEPPSASGSVRKLTSAMPRSPADTPGPLPLHFPRGQGTHFSIGRDASCDLAISDMTVSRVHARLERTEEGGWLLTDLASTNGTRVNGWRVRGQVQVQAGDLVSFGNAEYSLSTADGG